MLRPDEVLEPTKTYSDHFPVNLASCSSTALKMHDTDYSATSTVQNFIQRAWVGVQFIQVHPPQIALLCAVVLFWLLEWIDLMMRLAVAFTGGSPGKRAPSAQFGHHQ